MERYVIHEIDGKKVRIDTYVLEAVRDTPKWVKGTLFYFKGWAYELGLWTERDDADSMVWIDPTNSVTIFEPQAWNSPRYLQFKVVNR